MVGLARVMVGRSYCFLNAWGIGVYHCGGHQHQDDRSYGACLLLFMAEYLKLERVVKLGEWEQDNRGSRLWGRKRDVKFRAVRIGLVDRDVHIYLPSFFETN